MSGQDQQYTPSEDLIIEAWKRYSSAQDAKYARLSDGDAGDEARRFLAQVRREALTKAAEVFDNWGEEPAAESIRFYRDHYHPEVTP
ncbi:hypothetical protein NLU66_16620 [Brachybacterium sp. NBEC-018]|uniref:hypothetical protein n=1 Tax=Brachybacterium sp. NBEC-018 TaxID=2996004 RepID=UPI002175240F|nr:hypothetical protein [Brachybacterium sp. NBEC-018]UVY83812.1 hypothetical protein NLU66_16620 [Brachybacterium sp. NBEC-018]